jgi:hypothetical protein
LFYNHNLLAVMRTKPFAKTNPFRRRGILPVSIFRFASFFILHSSFCLGLRGALGKNLIIGIRRNIRIVSRPNF